LDTRFAFSITASRHNDFQITKPHQLAAVPLQRIA